MAITYEEKSMLLRLRKMGLTLKQIAEVMGRNENSLKTHLRILEGTVDEAAYLSSSPYPLFDQPLEMTGDALILSDTEFPFHEADFLNRVLDLAVAWDIRQLILAGDAVHFDSLSAWGAHWREPSKGGLSEDQELDLINFIADLPEEKQEEGLSLIREIGRAEPKDGMSEESGIASRELNKLGDLFDQIDYVIGNHDDRFLRMLNSPLFASSLLVNLQLPEPKWRIAPYYYSYLESSGVLFRIEHPNTAARTAASRLASKYLCNVIVAHNHVQTMERDVSGSFWAINSGCCVDEKRLAYAAQRSTAAPAHSLGAVIVRDGFPYLLSPDTPWRQYEKMA